MLTKAEITEFLKTNGIKRDDKVVVHASLRSAGPIENGADGLIDAMISYLDRGLLLIPTHSVVAFGPDAAANTCISEYYPNYKEAFEYTGAVTYGKLGNSTVYVCDARKMTDTVKTLWEKADHDLCIKQESIPREYYLR